MRAGLPQLQALRSLSRDARILFGTRFVRLFAYGMISVVLVLYLAELGLSDARIGTLLTLTLVGDIGVSLAITTQADRRGRRVMLVAGALLMALGGLMFAATDAFVVLLIAATAGVLSPSGGEVGPFLPIEQASLSQIVPATQRLDVFAWYNLTGSVATALGAFAAGVLVEAAQDAGVMGAAAYQPVLLGYATIGGMLAGMFLALSPTIEPPAAVVDQDPMAIRSWLGLHRSRRTVFHLSALFAMDAFGGGLIMQSLLAYWLHLRFGVDVAALGGIFLAANLLAGVSALAAGWLARRIGLINTMVFTHLPSNILLIAVPLMPTVEWAVAALLLRFSISQMDVPTRQAYTVAVVAPDERAAASGITAVARSIGSAISPAIATRLLAYPALMSMPLILAGVIKIVYDLLLWRAFASVEPEETDSTRGT